MKKRLLTLIEWGVVFDDIDGHASDSILGFIQGALVYDKFQLEIENQKIILYPKDMPEAKIYIQQRKECFQIETKEFWQSIDLLIESVLEKNA